MSVEQLVSVMQHMDDLHRRVVRTVRRLPSNKVRSLNLKLQISSEMTYSYILSINDSFGYANSSILLFFLSFSEPYLFNLAGSSRKVSLSAKVIVRGSCDCVPNLRSYSLSFKEKLLC